MTVWIVEEHNSWDEAEGVVGVFSSWESAFAWCRGRWPRTKPSLAERMDLWREPAGAPDYVKIRSFEVQP